MRGKRLVKALKWGLYEILRKFVVRSCVDWKRHDVIVFESDDWGLCGNMRDAVAKEELINKGYDVSSIEYKDTLETATELENLYKTLESHKDGLGRNAVFTPNYITSNPNYDKIMRNEFKTYFWIPITKGFSQDWNDENERGDLLAKWREGINRHVWCPEYHGLSHMNMQVWLTGLRRGDKKLRDFFNDQMFTHSNKYDNRSEYALKTNPSQSMSTAMQEKLISEGKTIFHEAFGYHPHTTIAPAYLWDENTEVALYNQGIKYIQGVTHHRARSFRKYHFHLLGEKHNNVMYLIRLIHLEYQGGKNPQWDYKQAYEKIVSAWKHGLPAIVSTHRVNYVGGIDPSMHISGINQLNRLLTEIEKNFGTKVTYMSDFEVAQLLDNGCSIQQYGDNEYVCRNYIPNHHQKFNVDVPGDWAFEVINLNTERMVSIRKIAGKNGFGVSFTVPEGDYVICRT